MQTQSRNYLWGQRADLLRPSKKSYYHYQVIWYALMGNLTLKNRPKGLLIKSSLHVCVQGQESHSLTAVPSSFVLFCLCWTLANLLLTDWLVDRLIDWLIDWLIVIISVLVAFFCFVCVLFRVSVFVSVELFSALSLSLSHTHTHTHTYTHTHTQSLTHSHTWWDDVGTSFWPTAQRPSAPQDGSVCSEDVWNCCTEPAASRGAREGAAT